MIFEMHNYKNLAMIKKLEGDGYSLFLKTFKILPPRQIQIFFFLCFKSTTVQMLLVSLIFIRTLVLHFKNFKFNNKYWQTYRKFYVCDDFLNIGKHTESSIVCDDFLNIGKHTESSMYAMTF